MSTPNSRSVSPSAEALDDDNQFDPDQQEPSAGEDSEVSDSTRSLPRNADEVSEQEGENSDTDEEDSFSYFYYRGYYDGKPAFSEDEDATDAHSVASDATDDEKNEVNQTDDNSDTDEDEELQTKTEAWRLHDANEEDETIDTDDLTELCENTEQIDLNDESQDDDDGDRSDDESEDDSLEEQAKAKKLTLEQKQHSWAKLPNPALKEIFKFLVLSPAQQLTLSLVCKDWNKVIKSCPYFLGLTDTELKSSLALKNVAMAIAPVNSSGDIYHMLVMAILSIHYGGKIAPIYLASDGKADVEKQVKRGLNFVTNLGYGDCFFKLPTGWNNSAQPVVRQKQLITKLKDIGITRYLDNRIATSFIAWHVDHYGLAATTAIVRTNLITALDYFRNTQPKIAAVLDNFLQAQIKEFNKLKKNKKPIIIVHYRASRASNKEQSIDTLVAPIIKFLKDKYSVVVICAGGGYAMQDNDLTIDPFSVSNDLGKICHLALLLWLYANKEKLNLVGAIGNTSGTFDLLAFIGFKCFNIHNFQKTKDANYVDYQAWRLLLQSNFMAIETLSNALGAEKKGADSNILLAQLNKWLHDFSQPTPASLHLKKLSSPRGLNKSGFDLLDNVFCLGDDEKNVSVESAALVERKVGQTFGKFRA